MTVTLFGTKYLSLQTFYFNKTLWIRDDAFQLDADIYDATKELSCKAMKSCRLTFAQHHKEELFSQKEELTLIGTGETTKGKKRILCKNILIPR